jgi:hypothetical protein
MSVYLRPEYDSAYCVVRVLALCFGEVVNGLDVETTRALKFDSVSRSAVSASREFRRCTTTACMVDVLLKLLDLVVGVSRTEKLPGAVGTFDAGRTVSDGRNR